MGTHRKLTLHDADLHGRYEHGQHEGQQRPNHRGKAEPVTWETLTSSGEGGENMLTDNTCAWFMEGDVHDGEDCYDAGAWDKEYLKQSQPGHTKAGDCACRQTLTAHLASHGVKRPKPKHW